MILFLDDGFKPEKVLKELLKEREYRRKCGYMQLYVKSDKHKINFLKLICNYEKESDIKEYIYSLYKEMKQTKVIE